MFQVAGNTGNGVLEAACDAGIHGIGVDVDQHLSLADDPASQKCVVTSAEKFLKKNVSDAHPAHQGRHGTSRRHHQARHHHR